MHAYVPEDVYGFSLSYYEGDYAKISSSAADFILPKDIWADAPEIFNGNIMAMVTTIMDASGNTLPQLAAYYYDQLNRIKQMKTTSPSVGGDSWDA